MPPKETKISFETRHSEVLKRVFPEIKEEESAQILAEIMLDELLSLFDGTKRYLSLSHQYIDWMERIYPRFFPGEEFRESYFLNTFRFPPGSAAYMVRILRSRQNTVIHNKAIEELGKTLWETYRACNGKVPEGAGMKIVRLTVRAHRIYQDLVDAIIRADRNSSVEQPTTTTRATEFVQCGINLRHIHVVLNEFVKEFPAASDALRIRDVKELD